MAGDTNSNIFINIDTSQAMAQLRALEKELTALNRSLIVGTKSATQAQSKFAQSLLHNVNATGQWSAQMVQMRTATEQFGNALDRSKLSLREYFRYGVASSRTFGRTFGREFDTVSKLVEKRVKTLQSQYIQLGRNAQGAMEAMRFTPKQLNYNDVTTRLMTAIQRQQIFNKLLDDGATKLLNFGKNTQWAGRQLMVGFTVPLMLLGSQAIKTFKEIETQALRFRKVYGDLFTDPGETEKALGNIRKLADEYTKYGLKVADTIKMAADAAAAGNVGKQLERIVDQSNKLAVLGGVTQEAAYETTLSLQNAFKIRGTELNQTIDFLNAVENQTVVAIEDLTAAIPRVAPVVQQLGGDVKDLAFFMAAMQEGGISAEQGANALKSGLASLINPSKAAAKAAGELGINLKGIIEANQGNLRNIVVGFAKSLEPLTELQRAQIIERIFGKYQFARISALLNNVTKEGTQAARVLDLANRSVEEMALLSQRELKMAEESPLNKFNKSVEQLRASLAPIGELFAKTLTPVFEFIGRLADKFNSLPDGIKKAVAIIIGIVGGIGPIFLMTFGLMANALANILKLFNMMRKGYQQLAYGSSDAALKTQYLSQEELENISVTNALYSAHQNLSAAYKLEATALAALAQQYGVAKTAMTNFAATNPGMFLPPGARGRFRGYNKGTDRVPGYSKGVDSVPAMLTPGEAVIPEPQASKNRPLIRSIIADKLPQFAVGRLGFPHPMRKTGPVDIRGPKNFKTTQLDRRLAEQISDGVKKSRFGNIAPTNFGTLIEGFKGRSFPIPGVGGIYRKPNGELVVVKPTIDEKTALAEIRATEIARNVQGLISPKQTIKTMMDPTDPAGQRKIIVLESPYDPRIANVSGKTGFTSNQMIKQLVASTLRADKDLSSSNVFGNVLADVGTAGVFGRASGFRDYEKVLPGMGEMGMINLLGVKGGAKKFFAQETSSLAAKMTPRQYQESIVKEIDKQLPKLRKLIDSWNLNPIEKQVYENMYARLEAGKRVDWQKLHAVHTAAGNKAFTNAAIAGKLPKYGGGKLPVFGAAAQLEQRAMATRTAATTVSSRRRGYEEFIAREMDDFVYVTARSGAGDGQSVTLKVRKADLPAFRSIVEDNEAYFADPARRGIGEVKIKDGIAHANTTEGKMYYAIKRKQYDKSEDGTVLVTDKNGRLSRKSIISALSSKMPAGNLVRKQEPAPAPVTAKKKAIIASPASLKTREALADEMMQLREAVRRNEIDGVNEAKLYEKLKIKPATGDVFDELVGNIRSGTGGFASSHIIPKSKIDEVDKWKLDNLMLDTNVVNEALQNTFTGPSTKAIALANIQQMEGMQLSDRQKILKWILQNRVKDGGFYDRGLAIRFDAPGYEDGTYSVPGPKGAGDIVPAMLAPGEAVIPADMAAKHRPLISDIIKDRLPGHIEGFDPFADDWGTSKTGSSSTPPPSPWTGNPGSWRDTPAPDPWGTDEPKASRGTRLRNATRSLITDKDINALKNLAKESGSAAKEMAITAKNSKAGQAAQRAVVAGFNHLGERLMADGDDIEENTKSRRANTQQTDEDTKQARKNARQERRMNFSNKMMMGTMAIGMPLTMIAGIQQEKNPDSFLGRNFENILVGSMIAGMLPLLNNKIGMILGPVAAVVGLYAIYKAQLNGAIKAGLEFGKSLNNSKERLDQFGQITGRFSATAIQDEKRRNRAAAVTPYDRTFGREFMGGELGKQFKQEFLNATGEETGLNMQQSAVVLANKLAQAVSQGVIDFGQAESIAVEIARSLGDTELELNARANLRKILGPDGSDLTKNPLAIQTRMILNNQDLNKSLMENIAATRQRVAGISGSERNQMLGAGAGGAALGAVGALKAINALKTAGMIAAGTGVGAPVAVAAVVTAVLSSVAMRAWQKGQENKVVAKTAGAYVGASTSSVESIQQGIDAVRQFADVQVTKLQTELSIAKTAKERLAIEQKIKDVQTQADKDTAELAGKQYEIIQGIVASRGQIQDEKNRKLYDKAIKDQTNERIKNLQGYQKTEALQLQSYMLSNEKFLSGKGFESRGPVKGSTPQIKANEDAIAQARANIERFQQGLAMEQGKTGGGDRNKIRYYNTEIERLNNQIQQLTNVNTSLQNARVTSKYDPEALMTQLNVMINAGLVTDADVKGFLEWTAATGDNPQVKLDIIAKTAGAESGRTLAILNAFATPEAKQIYYELIEKKKGQKDSQSQIEGLNNAMEEYRSIAAEAGIDMDKVLANTANKTASYFGEVADKTRDTYRERVEQFAQEKAFIDKNLNDPRWTKANKEQRKKILIELQEKAGGAGKNLTLDRAIENWDKISKYDDSVEKKAIFSYSVTMDAQGTQDLIKKEIMNEFYKSTNTPIGLKSEEFYKLLDAWMKKNQDKVKAIANKYQGNVMDRLFEPGGVLGPPKVDDTTTPETAKKDFGWLQDLGQRLKLFKETTFNALAPLKELERFFAKNAKTMNNSLDDQVGVMRQLADVAPDIALSPEFIRVLESMDPEQFKMWAKDLFEFDKTTGRLKGITQTFRNINEGFNTARIGEFIEKQNQSIKTTNLQIQAYDKLAAAGADSTTIMKIIADEALATAIASNKIVKEEIAGIISTAKAAQDLMDKLGLKQNLAEKLSSINSQRQALIAMRLAGVEAETASQFANDPRLANAIKNLAAEGGAAWAEATAKLKEYNTQQKELKKLIDATADQGTYESNRLKMAQKYFEVQSQIIDMQNRVSLGKLNKELEFQERVLEQLNLRQQELTEKYLTPRELIIKQNNYALDRLSYIEDQINQAYQDQVDALNQVYDLNSKIGNLEKSRLSIADALTRGDISAAATAVAEARRAGADTQKETILNNLENQKKILTLSLGRKQLEEQNKILQLEIAAIQQYQIDTIEAAKSAVDRKIESLNREVTTIERIIELQKESILYFGMTKQQIDDAVTLLDLANDAGIDINSPTFLNNVLKGAKGDAEALSAALKQVGTDAMKAFNDMQALRTGTIKAPTLTSTQPGDATPISSAAAAAANKSTDDAARRAAEAYLAELERLRKEAELKAAQDAAEKARIQAELDAALAREKAAKEAAEQAKLKQLQEEAERAIAAAEAATDAANAAAEAADAEWALYEASKSANSSAQASLELDLAIAEMMQLQVKGMISGVNTLNKLIKEGKIKDARALAASLLSGSNSTSGGGGGYPALQMVAGGGMIKKPMYMAVGGVAKGLDTVPAMLRPGEFIVSKFGVDNFGTDKLKAINSGTYSGDSVYNYNLSVNVKSDANPDDIARVVMSQIRQIDSQRIRTKRAI
jgi:TP901 family phage tail tape measure protein